MCIYTVVACYFYNFQKKKAFRIRCYLLVLLYKGPWGCEWHPLYGVAGCLYVRGCNSILSSFGIGLFTDHSAL